MGDLLASQWFSFSNYSLILYCDFPYFRKIEQMENGKALILMIIVGLMSRTVDPAKIDIIGCTKGREILQSVLSCVRKGTK